MPSTRPLLPLTLCYRQQPAKRARISRELRVFLQRQQGRGGGGLLVLEGVGVCAEVSVYYRHWKWQPITGNKLDLGDPEQQPGDQMRQAQALINSLPDISENQNFHDLLRQSKDARKCDMGRVRKAAKGEKSASRGKGGLNMDDFTPILVKFRSAGTNAVSCS